MIVKDKVTFKYLVVALGLVVVTSNILVQFLLGDWLTYATFTYPLAFLITDVANRQFGKKVATKVVLYGFVVGVLCSLVAASLSLFGFAGLTTVRIAIGSALAFATAQLVDVQVFARLKDKSWWVAPLTSSFLGSLLDTFIFFAVSFSTFFIFLEVGNDVSWANEPLPILGIAITAPLWVSMAVADLLVKLLFVVMMLVPYRYFTNDQK